MADHFHTPMYLPVLVSLTYAKTHLDEKFESSGVDTSLMMREILKGIFGTPTTFRVMMNGVPEMQDGAHGVFNMMRPMDFAMSDVDVSLAIHEAETYAIDQITDVIPEAAKNGVEYRFSYGGEAEVFIYVLVRPDELPQDLRSKIVPYSAVVNILE